MDNTALYTGITGLTAILSFLLGYFVYLYDKKALINKAWFKFSISIAIWSFGYFLSLANWFDHDLSLFCSRFSHASGAFIPVLFFNFVIVLLEQNKKYQNLLKVGYLLSVVLFALCFSPFIVKDVLVKLNIKFYPEGGVLYPLYGLMYYIYAGYGNVLLFNAMRRSKGDRRNQLIYFFVGTSLGFAGGVSLFFLIMNINIPPFGSVLIAFYPIVTSYAIIKHKLMDIQVLFKKTLLYSTLIAIITSLYLITIFILERFFSSIAGYRSIPITISIIAVFSIILTPLKNRIQRLIDNRFFHGTIDEIDAEKRMLENELARSERLKTVSTLAAGMAHEIKNPLTSIKTFVEFEEKKYNDPEFREKFRRIVPGEIDKIGRIINQLLDYAKVEKVSMKESSVHSMLDYVIDLYSHEFIKRKINVHKAYEASKDIIVCDENSLKQTFINIILNSIEAMHEGGEITVGTRNINGNVGAIPWPAISNSQGRHESPLQVFVSDTGPGIPKEILKDIFNPFFTTKEKGTGLGLFIVHQIILNNNGKIEIESEIGKGTTVNMIFIEGK